MTLGGGTPSFVTKHPTAESVLHGLSYDSNEPSSIFLENSISCRDHKEFVGQILYEKIRSGAIRDLG